MKRKRVLVTGCNGMVGRELVPRLVSLYDLTLWDKAPSIHEGFSSRQVDLTVPGSVEATLEPFDAVVHLAIASYQEILHGEHHTGEVTQQALERFAEQTLRVNNDGTFFLMEACRELRIPKFVFMSSLTVLQGSGDRILDSINLTQPPDPRDLYACTKLFGENLGRLFGGDGGMGVFCFRLGQPFPVDHPDVAGIYEDIHKRSILVHHDDIAEAVRCAVEYDFSGFGIANLVSAQAAERFPESDIAATEMNFSPLRRIGADGAVRAARPISAD